MLRAAHHLKHRSGSNFGPQNPSRNRSWQISICSAGAHAIWGDRANGLTQKNAFGGAAEVVLLFASVEPGH